MQERHSNRTKYFEEQVITTKKFVIPYVNDVLTLDKNTKVLEIGCGEGGNLVPFIELGCQCLGVDLNQTKIDLGKKLLAEYDNVNLIYQDIYDVSPEKLGKFDLIIMRDVIEHIHDQEKFMSYVKAFLVDGGYIYFGFPPWYMPFGGHQQVCKSKVLSSMPYYHILPAPIYKGILNSFGEDKDVIEGLLEVKETGISIERFRRIIKKEKYKLVKETLYLINPNYETKFGLKPKEQFGLIKALPFFRNVFSTCGYYLIQKV